jgi:hypothetical protein
MDSEFILKPFLSKIATIIQTYSSESAIELELRLHKYGKHYSKDGDNGINLKDFNRLKSKLEELFGEPEEIHSKDLINSSTNQRQTIRYNKETGEEEIFTIEKHPKYSNSESKYKDDLQVPKEVAEKLYIDFGTKLSLALETKEIKSKEIMKTPSLVRVKHRYSWILKKTFTRIDLTKVTQYEPLSQELAKTRFEVEIESIADEYFSLGSEVSNKNLTDFIKAIQSLDTYLKLCIKTLHNSDKLYSFSMQKEVANFFNTKLNYKKFKAENLGIPEYKVNLPVPGIASSELAVQARGLMKQDLRYGELIGGKYQYTVTHKAEGFRKFLVIHENGVWLLGLGSNATECNLIYPSRTSELDYNHWISYKNTIIDGEEIPMDNSDEKPRKGNYPDILHYYLPFDVLVIKGEDIRNKNLLERQSYIQIFTKITREPEDKLLLIEEKLFYLLSNNPEETYEVISKLLNDTNINYETDGLIFTPNSVYFPPENNKKYKKDTAPLSEQRAICKWKPLDKASLDLKYKVTSKGRNFYSSKGNEDILFEGSSRHPFDPEKQIDWYHPIFENLNNGEVVELSLKNYDENDNVILKPLRIRYDKSYANKTSAANSVWKDINEPISKETLTGQDTSLVFQAHSFNKRSVLENTLIKEHSHLIDIGSGRGGDLSKLHRFSDILLIEPDSNNLKDLKKRLDQKTIFPDKNFKVLQAGGEDSQKILVAAKEIFGNDFGKKPLYISMMLSLSFFWKSKNFLQQLCNTINLLKEAYFSAGGKEMGFLYMTIEGERTYDLLTKNNNFIKLNDVSLSYYPEKELVHLSFPEKSIVKEQDEYLVNLYELFNLTGMEPIYEKVSEDEKFLSKAEKIYSSLYVYGQARIDNSPFVLYEKEPEIPIPKVPENKEVSSFIETISDKSPKMYSVKDKKKIPDIKEVINLEPPREEKIFTPQKTNSTLFECLIKYFNPESEEIPYNEVVKYRNSIALSVKEVNPFDLKGRTIYDSAGKGIIKKISKDVQDAIEWISSDNELKPKYIAWLPDVIGYNIQVNDVLYPVKIQNEELETIHLIYEQKSYKLRL